MATTSDIPRDIFLSMENGAPKDFLEVSKEELSIFLLTLGTFCLCFVGLRSYLPDDFYIHLTIARNFAEGAGPYFNQGERVMATSSLLWTLLLGGWLFSGLTWALFPLAAALISALSVTVYQQILAELLERKLSFTERVISCVLIVAVLFVSGAQLMETPLALLLTGCSMRAMLRSRYAFGGVLAAAAIFTRLECLAFMASLGVWVLITNRQKFLSWCAGLLSASATLSALCLYYFGTLIPHTVIAKRVIYSLGPGETLSLIVTEFIGKKFLTEFPLTALSLIVIAGAFIIVAAASARIGALLRSAAFFFFLIPGTLVIATYFLSRVFVFPWYAPLYALPLILALLFFTFSGKSRVLWIALGSLALPLLFNLSKDALSFYFNPSWYSDFDSGAKARGYLAAGEALSQRFPNLRLVTSEIGALGFSYKGVILDAAGLATPEALEFQRSRPSALKAMHGAVPLGFIEKKNPELIVGLDLFLREFFSSTLKANYYLEQMPIFLKEDMQLRRDEEFQQSTHLNIFIRKDLLELSH